MPNGESYTSLTLKLHGYSGQLTKVCSKELFDKVIGSSFGSNEKTDDLMRQIGATKLKGFSLRYIYFIDKSKEKDLTVPILPYSMIDEMNARMYKGVSYKRNASLVQEQNSNFPVENGGATPTGSLHNTGGNND